MLYLIPTPVGNLEDITLRALRTLKEVDYVLAEDTRVSRKLLSHYDIQVTVKAYHAHNEHAATNAVIRDLQEGKKIGLVTDAGTPGISDPGYLLVNACIENDIPYTCLPGANAVIPALVMSGFPLHAFQFIGFLPQKKGRQTTWEKLAETDTTVAFYESPHRLLRALGEAVKHCGPKRKICVVREISKIHEEAKRGSTVEVLQYYQDNPEKCAGEIVIVLHPQG